MAEGIINPLDKIAEILTTYYKPIQMIEHKYRTKVTAIGLLKTAQLSSTRFMEPYLHRLVSYKALIKDHTDNLKLAHTIALKIFMDIMLDVLQRNMSGGNEKDHINLNHIITLVYSRYNGYSDRAFVPLRNQFIQKYNNMEAINKLAAHILDSHLNQPSRYDLLADKIVKHCLTGVTQEEVIKRISNAVFNFFVYGLYSRAEATNIYNINMQHKEKIESLKYFTKINSLTRTVINNVGSYMTTVNFFGTLWDSFDEIKELFKKYPNITVMFY